MKFDWMNDSEAWAPKEEFKRKELIETILSNDWFWGPAAKRKLFWWRVEWFTGSIPAPNLTRFWLRFGLLSGSLSGAKTWSLSEPFLARNTRESKGFGSFRGPTRSSFWGTKWELFRVPFWTHLVSSLSTPCGPNQRKRKFLTISSNEWLWPPPAQKKRNMAYYSFECNFVEWFWRAPEEKKVLFCQAL